MMDAYSESYAAGRDRAGAPPVMCQHCEAILHLDPAGWWVGDDETSDCDQSPAGHEVDGWTRVL